MAIARELIEILACAFCKSAIRVEGQRIHCGNAKCGLVYRVEDDIPIMLIEEAERPCPKCKTTRDWKDDVLSCSKCRETLVYERKA